MYWMFRNNKLTSKLDITSISHLYLDNVVESEHRGMNSQVDFISQMSSWLNKRLLDLRSKMDLLEQIDFVITPNKFLLGKIVPHAKFINVDKYYL